MARKIVNTEVVHALLIPHKTAKEYDMKKYGTDMRKIETWAIRYQSYVKETITTGTIKTIKATIATIKTTLTSLTNKIARLGNSSSAYHNTTIEVHTGTNFVTSSKGPTLTITTGTKVLIVLTVNIATKGVTQGFMGYKITGATTVAATTGAAAAFRGLGGQTGIASVAFSAVISVNAGSNTFTCAYKGGASGTTTVAYFSTRHLTVVCLN